MQTNRGQHDAISTGRPQSFLGRPGVAELCPNCVHSRQRNASERFGTPEPTAKKCFISLRFVRSGSIVRRGLTDLGSSAARRGGSSPPSRIKGLLPCNPLHCLRCPTSVRDPLRLNHPHRAAQSPPVTLSRLRLHSADKWPRSCVQPLPLRPISAHRRSRLRTAVRRKSEIGGPSGQWPCARSVRRIRPGASG